MIMETAVYNIKRKVVGYMILEQNIHDETNKEYFIGFKKIEYTLFWELVKHRISIDEYDIAKNSL